MVFIKIMTMHLQIILFGILLTLCSCKKDPKIPSTGEHGSNDTVIANFEIKGISYVATNTPIDSSNIAPLNRVNCNWISQMPFAFCELDSTHVTFDPINQWWGETDAGIITTTQLAKVKGIKTMLKPQLWVSGSYTGAFVLNNETDWLTWENNYKIYILHFAHLADSLGIEMFCVGTELKLVVQSRPAFWNNLIDTIKTFYSGKLTYAANWDDYQQVPFWNKLDYIGIDGYFPLSNNITSDVRELVNVWQNTVSAIDQYRSSQNKNVIFTEIGYKSVNACTYEPWNPTSTNLNLQAQANAIQSFLEAFAYKPWFKGAFLWKWYPQYQTSGGLINKDYTPQNKPTEIIIRKCY
ncbi:MAG: glycoside hydrolase [Bacteroidetes bacterium]|nr:glycoside hydrolase [Bacteroidota bacterium]